MRKGFHKYFLTSGESAQVNERKADVDDRYEGISRQGVPTFHSGDDGGSNGPGSFDVLHFLRPVAVEEEAQTASYNPRQSRNGDADVRNAHRYAESGVCHAWRRCSGEHHDEES